MMLHKSWISNIEIYSEAWHQFRLGKFTSSKASNLMGQKGLTADSTSYINQKVGELLTGQSGCGDDDREVETEYTAWGVVNEPLAMKEFSTKMGVKFLVTGKLIHRPGTQFSSTPDGIWVINSSITEEDHYNVATVEVKCPHKFNLFINLYRCKSPAELKAYSKPYYWQVLDQMDTCDSAKGYFVAYHPLFPPGNNLRIIEFKKMDLWDDFSLLKQRKKEALQIFNDVHSEFLTQKA